MKRKTLSDIIVSSSKSKEKTLVIDDLVEAICAECEIPVSHVESASLDDLKKKLNFLYIKITKKWNDPHRVKSVYERTNEAFLNIDFKYDLHKTTTKRKLSYVDTEVAPNFSTPGRPMGSSSKEYTFSRKHFILINSVFSQIFLYLNI